MEILERLFVFKLLRDLSSNRHEPGWIQSFDQKEFCSTKGNKKNCNQSY